MFFIKRNSWMIFLGLACISFSSFANLKITDATVRLLPPSVPNTSAYFKIQNTTDQNMVLVSANTEIAQKAELHAHVMQNGMMSMKQQNEVVVPAGETISFQPGGLHVMIFGLKKPLQEGQIVSITLVTKDQKNILVDAKVTMPGKEKSHSHH